MTELMSDHDLYVSILKTFIFEWKVRIVKVQDERREKEISALIEKTSKFLRDEFGEDV